ncbi:MAG TPA: hypothetical protein VK253_07155 [Candidatus Binatia bacterium]|nr:hypothetical protein [Candidatus Binatia bacterium]
MAEEKAGKVKFTFEMEINPPVLDLIRQDIDMMMDLAAQATDIWRRDMSERRRRGYGLGMGMMHHGGE